MTIESYQEKDRCCNESTNQQGRPESRIKSFDECVIEEQIGRLHATLVDLRRDMGYQTRTIRDLIMQVQRLNDHNHCDGKVVVGIVENTHGIGMGGSISGPDLLS